MDPRKASIISEQLRNTLNHLDDEDGSSNTEKADVFFDSVDRDKNGTIDRKEFAKVYSVLTDHVKEEHMREEAAKTKIAKAQRRLRMAFITGVIMAIILGISIAGNFVTTNAVIQMTKDQYVSEGTVVGQDGTPLAQAKAVRDVSLSALVQPEGRQIVRSMEEVNLRLGQPDELSFKLIGYNYSGTLEEPKLELYGIRSKVCLTTAFHVDINIDAPCPTEISTARKLSTYRELTDPDNPDSNSCRNLCTSDAECGHAQKCMEWCTISYTKGTIGKRCDIGGVSGWQSNAKRAR